MLIKMLSAHQRASDTVKFNTTSLYNKILSIEQKPRLRDYVIKFLFINWVMKYPSLKTCVYTKHCHWCDVFYYLYAFNSQWCLLKDASLYLDSLIIVYKFCSLLSILNELTLQKELHCSLERYLSTTETTKRVVWSQAI